MPCSRYNESDDFVKTHPYGGFTQHSNWHEIKNNWEYEVVISKDNDGVIRGSMAILIQRIPLVKSCFFYSPRGPVCDPADFNTLKDLKEGVDTLAKKYNAHMLKIDPDVLVKDVLFIENMKKLGFSHSYGPDGFEGIQARFNYRLYLNGRSEEELLANLTQSTRRKVRIAIKNEVEIKVADLSYLDEFHRIMKVTGERDGFNIRPKEYFERFLTALGENARLYIGTYQGNVICGAITTNMSGKCCYVYGASDNAHRNVMPNYLMQWEMIKWAVNTNCTVYDFQGVSGNLSPENNHMFGLYQFKSGFHGTLDELVGEFDFTYRPLATKMVDKAVVLNEQIRTIKRKLKGNS